ncbi:MAG: VCBS repeat-containing protein, partial [Acidobacteria bacterium]|nr:VCBS repeat-containing protein [Acidobacteriota bacterium]
MKKIVILGVAGWAAIGILANHTRSPVFLAQKIDGPSENWYGPFSEGSAVFDVDNDGVLDMTAGGSWYEGPAFMKHPLREVKNHGEFTSNSGDHPVDVNGDRWTDLISSGWFEDRSIYWYENNRGAGGLWKRHKVADSSTLIETLLVEDVDGDGDADILPNHVKVGGVYWIEMDKGTFSKHTVGPDGDQHGIGLVDLDGDGRKDILTPAGWYRAPEDRRQPWEWHPEYNLEGLAGIRILAYDVNGDGRNDLIYGMGHDYGLYWMEQKRENGRRLWRRHTIEDTWSQAHTLVLADVKQDGRLDLVTGKRIRGHGEKDPGSLDPMGIYWYEIYPKTATFTRHVISYNSMVGTGMQMNIIDIDKD